MTVSEAASYAVKVIGLFPVRNVWQYVERRDKKERSSTLDLANKVVKGKKRAERWEKMNVFAVSSIVSALIVGTVMLIKHELWPATYWSMWVLLAVAVVSYTSVAFAVSNFRDDIIGEYSDDGERLKLTANYIEKLWLAGNGRILEPPELYLDKLEDMICRKYFTENSDEDPMGQATKKDRCHRLDEEIDPLSHTLEFFDVFDGRHDSMLRTAKKRWDERVLKEGGVIADSIA